MKEVKNKIAPTSDYMRQLKWFPVSELPELAFDHRDIITLSLERLKKSVTYSTAPYELLPTKFTLTQLQQVYESILNKKLDKRNFRKKINNLGYLKELNEYQKGVSYRAAKLYSFDKRKFHKQFSQD